MIDSNGNILDGFYKDGKKVGKWIIKDKKNDVCEGSYSNDLKTGEWTEKYTDGSVG